MKIEWKASKKLQAKARRVQFLHDVKKKTFREIAPIVKHDFSYCYSLYVLSKENNLMEVDHV